jgi:uncharacterized protein (DUF952 family)
VSANIIYHITSRDAWNTAADRRHFAPATLADEGFVHCSLDGQLAATANRFFRGQSGLVVLRIDAARLTSPVRFEDLGGAGERFPHIYGPVNVDAVLDAVDLPLNPDGTFEWSGRPKEAPR